MTTSISERATAYRTALRLALNDGLSVKDAIDLAKRAARGGIDIPQQKPVVLTDAELRLIDENELTADECDRLLELEQAEDAAEIAAFNATLPTGGDYGPDVSTTEMIDRDRDAFNEDEATKEGFCCSNCGIPHAIHGDECGQIDYPACRIHDWTKALNAEARVAHVHPTLADAWRDGVGITTPAGLRIKAQAAFMAELDEALNPGCTDRELAAEKGYVDYGEDLSHAEKVAAGMPDCVGDSEGCQCEDCRDPDRVRDCDTPATLRAIELPATEDHNSYRLWFDGDDEMNQFLAGRCLYADADRSIKDRDGKIMGMWFYAHFGPTPTS